VAFAAAGVFIDLVHQLAHGVHAITHHMGRIATGGSHQLVTHHQQAEVMPRQVALHHDLAILGRHLEGQRQMLVRDDVDGHALALVAIARLDHHGPADLGHHLAGLVHRGHGTTDGHRHPGSRQQALGEVLVLSDGLGHRAGAVDLGGPDAPLTAAPAQLHQAALRQTAPGNATGLRSVHDAAGAGPQTHVLVQFAQFSQHRLDIKRLFGHHSRHQLLCGLERPTAHRFLGVLHHHLVHTIFRRGGRATEGDRAACLRLQAQGDHFQHMGQTDARGQGLRAPGSEGRQDRTEAVLNARPLAEVSLVLGTFHHRLDGGVAAPEVGAAQDPDAGYVHDG